MAIFTLAIAILAPCAPASVLFSPLRPFTVGALLLLPVLRPQLPCLSVVWTSLGPLPQWVPGPTTRWAPGTTRLALHGT
jgi:hypothetical protein